MRLLKNRPGVGTLTLTLGAFVTVLALAWSGALGPIDQALQDVRFKTTDRPPSGDTVFVEIDAESLATVGVWPWPRERHAAVLDRLMDLGSAEVVFDIDFSTTSTPEGDLALEEALERAGGYALLAAFQQITADGTVVLNTPIARFAAHSEAVLVNVDGDGTRLLRSVPVGLPEAGIRSVAAALVPEFPITGPTITIDYGIDVTAIKRIPISQLLDGEPDRALFAGKQVIVGASAVELRDFFRVPRFGVIPGPLVQLAAVETMKAGRPLADAGLISAFGAALLAVTLYSLGRRRMPLGALAWAILGSMFLIEVAAWLALGQGKVILDTAPFHLCAIILLIIGLMQDRARHWREIFRQQSRLAYLANHDAVTDAMSRQALLDQIATKLVAGTGSVFLVQLDWFDRAVAALGHDVGDSVATQVSQRLERQLGAKPARIANDVFAWCHQDKLEAEQQLALCHWISSCLDAPYAINGHSVVLDTRFGSSAGDQETSAGELLRQAEVALAQGRSDSAKAVSYAAEQSERIKQRRLLDLALRQALEREEFFLLYQPQVDLATGDLVGVEALVRWQSDSLGLVSPADFIPLAEETGLIVKLGEWVLREACREAAGWDWNGRLSVNVSSVQFKMADVVGTVRAALEASGFPAQRLDIELTESLFVDNDPTILSALESLQRMGIGVALDDFGTGYSSLSYLSRLPIDKLKIDQSFIRPLPDQHNEAIVETIVLMANRLGKTVVAEGIETVQQRDYLTALGCQIGQGYLFGKPGLPVDIGLKTWVIAAA